MDAICAPVQFNHNGKTYTGHLAQVSGAAGTAHFHLYINERGGLYYYGQMNYSELTGWRFSSQTGLFTDLSEYFGACLVNWCDSNYING